jgi:hypothetical protein
MLMSAFCVNSILQINLEMSLIYMDILAYTISMYKKASGPIRYRDYIIYFASFN